MEIVIVNDDGITAPGIRALAESAQEFGNVTIIAPDKNWSSCGHQKALGRPMRVDPYTFPGGIPAYSTDAGPSDCAALACLGFLEKKVDLVLSGINPTPNLGRDMTYSGTVTAALEASIWGVRAVAFSLDTANLSPSEIDFSESKKAVAHVLRTFIAGELPPFTILNVNIPYLSYDQIKGYKVTHGGDRYFTNHIIRRTDPFGRPYYWFGGNPPTGDSAENSDTGNLARGYVCICPAHNDLTVHQLIEPLSKWNWN